MTKNEAIEIFRHHTDAPISNAIKSIDALIALGILRVEEPKTATERALQAINHAIYNPEFIVFKDGEHLIKVLNEAGVRIVDR